MDRADMKRVQVLDALEILHAGRGGEELLVRQAMTPDPSCVPGCTSVLDLVRMFHAKAFRHLLVTDESRTLLGVISDRDVLRFLGPGSGSKEKLSQIQAHELMSTDVVTVGPQTPIAQAIDIMIDQGISCLPIVEEGRLIGIMTNTDLHIVLQMLLQTVRLTGAEKPAPATRR